MKILNLHAGLGGNRLMWRGHEVTAVESYKPVAEQYRKLYPDDIVIEGDAQKYLIDHYKEYDFVWASPPCQKHSKMMKATRHDVAAYPDMSLYEIIIFLDNFFKGGWVVENVVPYYKPLITPAQKLGRHLFWANFYFPEFDVERPKGFITKSNLKSMRDMQDWLGIHYEKPIYYKGNHCPTQVLRNCVHPKLGRHILDWFEKTRRTEKRKEIKNIQYSLLS